MQITVKDLMSQQPVSVGRGTSIDEALTILLRNEVAEVYVTDEAGKLMGVVPDFELLKAMMNHTPGSQDVTNLMSSDLAIVRPDRQIAQVVPVFRVGRYQRMAVVEDGRLVGQIDRRDILRLMATLREIGETIEAGDEPSVDNHPSSQMRRPQFMQTRQTSRSQIGQEGW